MKPMKGDAVTDLSLVRVPKYASVKLDGYRAFKYGDQLMSSSFKPIRNKHLQALFAAVPHGWDGELITEGGTKGTFSRTSTIVTAADVPADGVKFAVFDNFAHEGPFVERIQTVHPSFRLAHYLLESVESIVLYEQQALQNQYEGIILRDPLGPYKNGYSTLREQWMLKVKRFADAEGVVTGVEEMYHNDNELKRDAQGYADRSSKKEGMRPAGVLGNLVVEYKGQVIRLGQGFTQEMRADYWVHPPIGKLAKFKYPPGGKPVSEGGVGIRPPFVFLGFRDRDDL